MPLETLRTLVPNVSTETNQGWISPQRNLRQTNYSFKKDGELEKKALKQWGKNNLMSNAKKF